MHTSAACWWDALEGSGVDAGIGSVVDGSGAGVFTVTSSSPGIDAICICLYKI